MRTVLVAAAAIALACARSTPSPAPAPKRSEVSGSRAAVVARAPLPPANPSLPAVPEERGRLQIKVVYPPENALISSRDSNFIFGSVGNGDAGLSINGELVPVWPNGAFMGWLPNPSVGAQEYDIVAYTATDTVHRRYPVRTRAAQPARTPYKPQVTPLSPSMWAVLRDDSLDRFASDSDNLIIARPTPEGTYHWFLFPRTVVRVVEYRDDMARVQLDGRQDAWVDRRDLKNTTPVITASVSPVLPSARPRITTAMESVDFALDVQMPPAYLVEEGERDITLTLYNTAAPAEKIAAVDDPLLADASETHDGSRTVYHFALNRPVYGYLALFEHGVFKLSIRRPPAVDASAPLKGMTIVVDPGHPPIGATGPTGLWEPVATLAVGLRVRDLLQEKGAHVVMTRTEAGAVALGDRPVIARRANANALISIHLNADPDGQNPFRDNGTGTYYFHPQSKPLAKLLQESLVPQLGLRNRGVFFQNLAVCRPTWFPSALAEGLFIIMPDQESAIRTPQYQEAYARGVVDGLQRYFATLAQ